MLEQHFLQLPVTDQGVVIPKAWLGDAKEVELRAIDGKIVVAPVGTGQHKSAIEPWSADDPIWQMGKNPVDIDITDASINLDKYLYDDPRRLQG